MSNVLFVGQAPGQTPGPPLSGRIGRRLACLLGMGQGEFERRFARANVLGRFPGKQGKGDAFPLAEAREAASRMCLSGFGTVILLGKSTARAFGVEPEYFRPTVRGGVTFVPFPHPSGVNRWWNDPANAALAGEFLRGITA